MEKNLTQRELAKYFIIIVVFAGVLTFLKVYDGHTGEIAKLGHTIFSKFLGR